MANLLLHEDDQPPTHEGAKPNQFSTFEEPTAASSERSDTIRVIVNCARHLLGLVNDVLDFEKIEARQLELEAVPFDVRSETNMVLSVAAFSAASKKVQLEQNFELTHCSRIGDPLRFRQVIFNLVSNAIKFTPPHGTVSFTMKDDRQRVYVEVHDTGIGISEAAGKNLFKVPSDCAYRLCKVSSNGVPPNEAFLPRGKLYRSQVWRVWSWAGHKQASR